ncbi:unnamed protein product [Diatraea saccharalis]|uniref:Uncharacterized protein n=1 Tax=Diatraea saccharalis TaxID=40085 RepID=A0A9N9WHE4_9NEOP|nr:unnamed protein product [Diatraea saccharalis]
MVVEECDFIENSDTEKSYAIPQCVEKLNQVHVTEALSKQNFVSAPVARSKRIVNKSYVDFLSDNEDFEWSSSSWVGSSNDECSEKESSRKKQKTNSLDDGKVDDDFSSGLTTDPEDLEIQPPRRKSTLVGGTSRRSGVEMDMATKTANEELQKGKTALKNAGSMKRECKLIALESLQSLYEIVLSLSDSRSRHKHNLEAEKARHARELGNGTDSIQEEPTNTSEDVPIASQTPKEPELPKNRHTIRRRDNPPELQVSSRQMTETFNDL